MVEPVAITNQPSKRALGNKEIASYLSEKVARYNIYRACMLGDRETVKNVSKANPPLLNSKEPPGFTKDHRAINRGGVATPVQECLISLQAKETKVDFYART